MCNEQPDAVTPSLVVAAGCRNTLVSSGRLPLNPLDLPIRNAQADAKLGEANQALAKAMALPLVWGHRSDPSKSAKTGMDVETNGRTTLYGAYLHRKTAAYCETTGKGNGLVYTLPYQPHGLNI